MKILKAAQLREADEFTINREPVAEKDLMERAALKCTTWLLDRFDRFISFTILAGPGNNGGDGLAIARQLIHYGRQVQVLILPSTERSPCNQLNLDRLKECEVEIREIQGWYEAVPDTVVIDALFGSGLKRPPEEPLVSFIASLNASGATIISIDLPSGLATDDNRDFRHGAVVRASYTLTLGAPKPALVLQSNLIYTGSWEVLDIGLHPDYLQQVDVDSFMLEDQDIREIYRVRTPAGHKGTYGHTLIIAGSKGKSGAALLCAGAAVRSGAGLVTVACPASVAPAIQCALPEAMVIESGVDEVEDLPDLSRYSVIACGPGIGVSESTTKLLGNLIRNSQVPLILDADAVNILAENKTWLSFIPAGAVITPHPAEFERLAGRFEHEEDAIAELKNMAVKYRLVALRKGACSAIAMPDGRIYFNSTGNPGMGTGGSGDVLTGIIAGLAAQGYTLPLAAAAGTFLHGGAGDIVRAEHGPEWLKAGDITNNLGKAWKTILD